MASVADKATVASFGGDARVETRGDEAAIAAWLCAIPCAAIVVLALLALGPPLGRLLTPPRGSVIFLPNALEGLHPEPTEHARYLIALCAPLLATLAIVRAPRWRDRVPERIANQIVIGTQLLLVALVVASIVEQYRLRFGLIYTRGIEPLVHVRYFTPPTLAVAACLAGVTAAVVRVPRLRTAADELVRDSLGRRMVAGTLAVAATVVWMLHAVHTDAEIGNALEAVPYHLGFTLDETFAVINGRTPLVDFTAQYGSLWPFAIAIPMLAFGKTVLSFTVVACTITAVALLAVYGVLRRVTRSAWAALLLYLPFLATSLFKVASSSHDLSSIGTYYGTFPLRYALPFLLAWLTARQLDRKHDSLAAPWGLFVVGGFAVLNNVEFGVAALGASIAALLWASPQPPSWRRLRRLGVGVACGLATAYALVSALTILRAGSLPDLSRLVEFARVYAVGGFAMMPIPAVIGVHLLVYLTYVAAIVVATVRSLRAAENRVLTGMLAWAGIFGLGAGAYFVGRSHPLTLEHEFSAWALALALLTIVAVRYMATRGVHRSAIAAFVVIFGFGLMVCSLAQTATPWGQIERLNTPFTPTYYAPDPEPLVPPRDPATRRFVASVADGPSRFVMRHGAPVAILMTTGHRVADAYGIRNVSPYSGAESIYTAEHIEQVLDALQAAGGNTVIAQSDAGRGIFNALRRRGFWLLTQQGLRPVSPVEHEGLDMLWPGGDAILKWVDVHHLHPRTLG